MCLYANKLWKNTANKLFFEGEQTLFYVGFLPKTNEQTLKYNTFVVFNVSINVEMLPKIEFVCLKNRQIGVGQSPTTSAKGITLVAFMVCFGRKIVNVKKPGRTRLVGG